MSRVTCEEKITDRGAPLERGIEINTDGTGWRVTSVGGGHYWQFETFEALIEWLEDQNEGLKISRMWEQKP